MQRKQFLKLSVLAAGGTALAGSAFVGCGTSNQTVKGSIIGANAATGHMLRDGGMPAVSSTVSKRIVIIGGGVSGLSAARELSRQGITDFVLLELDKHPGGNAASGSNEVSAFPWGAHYVPLPNNDLNEYLEFLQQAGCITGYDAAGLPIYNEEHLCFDPEERLYINGRWQEGLVPNFGLSAPEQDEMKRFMDLMNEFRYKKGTDGLDAFAIPVTTSSADGEFRKLDQLTMKAWMESIGFKSKPVHSYVNYCCRDDFGTPHSMVSAWAGIHYYASRKGRGSNASHADVLTWPEGIGFLINKLLEGIESKGLSANILTNALCFGVSTIDQPGKVSVDYFDTTSNKSTRIVADHCIVAVPQFVAARLIKEPVTTPGSLSRAEFVKQKMHYVPWMVANLKVKKLEQRSGAPASWDNVMHDRYSLGYVDATHQLLQQLIPVKNLTYYLPLTDGDPAAERRKAYQAKHADWTKIIFNELEVIHPGIQSATEEVNIMLWGHSMVQPRPGLIWGDVGLGLQTLRALLNDPIYFAHTDLSGISIFEEGFYQGLNAARAILNKEKSLSSS